MIPVALVGAGPGDVDLLTLRAEAVLAQAAIVVTDASVQHLARRFAPMADVAVVPDGRPCTPVLLAAAAGAGERSVARLYAGDPWLHPAHDAERAALHQAGMATEPVAGVAIEVAVPAMAGIAVHVRHLAVACTIGPLEAMPPGADQARTLVVPTEDGGAAARRLAAAGAAHLPAALVPVSTPEDVLRGALTELGHGGGPTGPCLLVVGAVVGPEAAAAGRHLQRAPLPAQPAGARADPAGEPIASGRVCHNAVLVRPEGGPTGGPDGAARLGTEGDEAGGLDGALRTGPECGAAGGPIRAARPGAGGGVAGGLDGAARTGPECGPAGEPDGGARLGTEGDEAGGLDGALRTGPECGAAWGPIRAARPGAGGGVDGCR